MNRASRTSDRRRGSRRLLFVLTSAAVLLVLLTLGWVFRNQVIGSTNGDKTDVIVDAGSTARSVSDQLAAKGVVWNEELFYWQLRLSGKADDVMAGRYEFSQGQGSTSVIGDITKGRFAQNRVTVPEGLTIAETAATLEKSIGGFDKAEFLKLAAPPADRWKKEFLSSVPATAGLEGYLFPETYAVDDKTDETSILNMMLDEFESQTNSLDWSSVARLGYDHFNAIYPGGKVKLIPKKGGKLSFTPYEVLIIASIIEKETLTFDEKPKVAAVIYNRLRNGWFLQIDATVLYALGKHKERLMFKDAKVKSPYNTYLNKGLPPGPICSPGRDSIEAALNPEATAYFYYVLSEPGRHTFTIKKSEFLKAKAEMKRKRRAGEL